MNGRGERQDPVATSLLSQQIPIFVAEERRWSGTWCTTGLHPGDLRQVQPRHSVLSLDADPLGLQSSQDR